MTHLTHSPVSTLLDSLPRAHSPAACSVQLCSTCAQLVTSCPCGHTWSLVPGEAACPRCSRFVARRYVWVYDLHRQSWRHLIGAVFTFKDDDWYVEGKRRASRFVIPDPYVQAAHDYQGGDLWRPNVPRS